MKYIIPRLLKKLRLFNNINLFPSIHYNNTKFTIPIIKTMGRSNLYLSRHEPWMLPFIENLVSLSSGVFIDVGVNIGQTLIKLKSIDPEVYYLGFEPNPYCVYYTNILIKKNKFKNTKMFPIGLSNENDLLKLKLNTEADRETSIIIDLKRPDRKSEDECYIKVCKFDDIKHFSRLNNVGIIKIDVEGMELEVIEGMQNLIARERPIIICEVLHAYSKETLEYKKSRNKQLIQILTQLKYIIYRIVKSEDERSVNQILEITVFDDLIWSDLTSPKLCDYLFVPKELTEIVIDKFMQ